MSFLATRQEVKKILSEPSIFKDFEHIANEELVGVETLKRRGSDGLDFHDVSVGGIASSLAQAYLLGKGAGTHREGTKSPNVSFTVDEIGFMHLASNKVLAAVVRGELDLNALAAETLKERGYDENEKWVGFNKGGNA